MKHFFKALKYQYAQADLETRILITSLFSGLLLCIGATFINIVIRLNFIAIFSTTIMGIGYVFFLYKAVIKDQYKIAAYGSILMLTLIVFPALWINNSGITGSIPYYFIFMVFLSAVVLHRLSYRWILLVQLITISSLLFFEYYNPNLIVPYTSTNSQFIDLSYSVLIMIVLIFLMIRYIMSEYHSTIAELKKAQSELESINQNLHRSSITDALTGLYNRRYIIEELDHITLNDTMESALIMIDIDYFKSINDQFGHPIGDSVLQSVGALIKALTPKTSYAARIGGEEFLILLTAEAAQNHKQIAERLRLEVQNSIWDIPELHVTISAGTHVLHNQESKELALKHVDIALYNSKKSGRNKVSTYKTPYSL